jgi:glycosyltransferase involved in cell wall biosynthesis
MLREEGYAVTLAYYQPYSLDRSLSVPSWRLGRRVAKSRIDSFEGAPVRQIGCWLPELEFTNYWPTRAWRDLIASHDYLLAVTGNPLAALPFAASGRPFLAWLGTPFTPDREARVKHFPLVRRLVDQAINSRVCLRQERRVLDAGLILPTTTYVAQEFRRVAPRARLLDPIPVPVETDFFTPAGDPEPISIAFVGKYNDPRKNILFLLDVLRRCRDKGADAILHLYGDIPSAAVRQRIFQNGLEGAVRGLRKISRADLLALYRSSTVYVIPSFQEGLCVTGLEAMACGCPVITSPCGGPLDYVRDGVNGRIVPLDVDAFAAAVLSISGSRKERTRLSGAAEATIRARFTPAIVTRLFRSALALLTNAESSAMRRPLR